MNVYDIIADIVCHNVNPVCYWPISAIAMTISQTFYNKKPSKIDPIPQNLEVIGLFVFAYLH